MAQHTDPVQEYEQLIRRYVSLGRCSAKGYEPTVCAVCNDYKERGGFKFTPSYIHYSCFNCGESVVYDSTSHDRVPKYFKRVLTTFGIPADEVEHIAARSFFSKSGTLLPDAKQDKPVWSPPKTIDPPSGILTPVDEDTSPWCEVARTYLELVRGLSTDDWPFFVSSDKQLEGRLIIPFMHGDRIIYWQARAMDDAIKPRYKNPLVEKDKIIFNYDEIYTHTSEPLFVTEGPLDSISIGERCVSMTGSTLSAWQLGELRKAAKRRKIIFVIDKNSNGLKVGLKVLAEGWYVTVMPDNIDDANEGRKKFGKLWLLSHISSTAVTGFAGKMLLEMKCKQPIRER
jgi:hypothetical protein